MQCSNARLLSSGGFGHLNDLNLFIYLFIYLFKDLYKKQQFRIHRSVESLLPCSELNKCEQSSLYKFHVSSGNLAVSR